MSAPFVVHSRAGQAVTQHSSLEEAGRAQETLRGPITQGGVVVVEARS